MNSKTIHEAAKGSCIRSFPETDKKKKKYEVFCNDFSAVGLNQMKLLMSSNFCY